MCRTQITRHKESGRGVRSDRRGRLSYPGEAAFTVTELMVAVALMSLIVFALFSMFNQVQKALRANVTQVDSSERGRAVLEMVSKELETTRAGMQPEVTNLWVRPSHITYQPGAQADIETNLVPVRSNAFNYVYYQSRQDKAWQANGFLVLETTTNSLGTTVLGPPLNGMGTLYRFQTTENNREFYRPTTRLFRNFWTNVLDRVDNSRRPDQYPPATNLAVVAEGVVHFRLLPYDTQGRLMAWGTTNLDPAYRIVRETKAAPFPIDPFPRSFSGDTNLLPFANVTLEQTTYNRPEYTTASFRSNALPAYLELELGVLEPDAMKRFGQMEKDGMGAQAKEYLKKRMANVQIFRKRIPLRANQ